MPDDLDDVRPLLAGTVRWAQDGAIVELGSSQAATTAPPPTPRSSSSSCAPCAPTMARRYRLVARLAAPLDRVRRRGRRG